MFDPQSDPLGIGLMARARERRQAQQLGNPAAQAYMSGPLTDENWDAFFQAADEATGGKGLRFRGGEAEGSNQLVGTAANPLMGLMHSGQSQLPAPTTQSIQQDHPSIGGLKAAGPHNEQELRTRRARMINQAQPAANFYPNTGTYNPFPS